MRYKDMPAVRETIQVAFLQRDDGAALRDNVVLRVHHLAVIGQVHKLAVVGIDTGAHRTAARPGAEVVCNTVVGWRDTAAPVHSQDILPHHLPVGRGHLNSDCRAVLRNRHGLP